MIFDLRGVLVCREREREREREGELNYSSRQDQNVLQEDEYDETRRKNVTVAFM